MVQHVKGNLRLAPALIAMEAEANRLAPQRSKASDGSFPSASHTAANPTSDHEVGDALDLTTDPAHGWDMAERFRLIVARRDPRVKYLIHNGTIWKSYPNRGLAPWTPQVYTGSNAHKLHGHTSVLHEYRNDTSPWWPEEVEDDMPLTDADLLKVAAAVKKVLEPEFDGVKKNADTLRDSLADLQRRVLGVEEMADSAEQHKADADTGKRFQSLLGDG
jgi:hypothetical protein